MMISVILLLLLLLLSTLHSCRLLHSFTVATTETSAPAPAAAAILICTIHANESRELNSSDMESIAKSEVYCMWYVHDKHHYANALNTPQNVSDGGKVSKSVGPK